MNNLCQCGCGKETTINRDTKKYNKFVYGHNTKGSKRLFTDTHRKHISSGKTGTTHSENTKVKISNSNIGTIFDDERRIKISKSKIGIKHSDISKRKMRISAIRRREIQYNNHEPLIPNIGDNERSFLNEIQIYTKFMIIRNDPSFRYLIGRYPDGHIKELKLFIQFDERHHFKDYNCTIPNDDTDQNTKDLLSIDGYQLFRVSEKEWKENKSSIIKQFQILLESKNEYQSNMSIDT